MFDPSASIANRPDCPSTIPRNRISLSIGRPELDEVHPAGRGDRLDGSGGGRVVQVELVGAGVELRDDSDALSVRRPGDRLRIPDRFRRDPRRVRAVGPDDVDVNRLDRGRADVANERNLGSVGRELREGVVFRASDEEPGIAGDRIADVQVTVGDIRDHAVGGRPERGRQASLLAAGVEDGRHQSEDKDREDDKHPPRDVWRGSHSLRKRRHREPPFREDPAGTLPCGGSPGQDDFGVIGAGAGTQIREDLRQLALDAGVVVHPTVPPDASEAAGAARPTSARMSPRARLSRDLAVPTGMPRQVATSLSGSPRK